MKHFKRITIILTLGVLSAFCLPVSSAAPPALIGMVVSPGSLVPSFSSTVTNYTLLVDSATSALRITPTSSGESITVGGVPVMSGTPISLTLATGQRSISIVSTASNLNTTYIINLVHNNGLIPTFSGKIDTPGLLKFSVTNYDSKYLWDVNTTAGTATIDASGNVTVVGIPPGISAAVTVVSSRDDYTSKSATVTSNVYPIVPKIGLNPTFSPPISTGVGFTTNFNNYDSSFDLVIKTNVGQVIPGSPTGNNLPLTVTGLTSGQSATITITTSKSGFLTGSGTITGSSIAGTGLTPVFSLVSPNINGFTVNIMNYDSAYTYNVSSSLGTITKGAASGSILPLTVTDLVAGQSALITVSTVRSGYTTVNATVSGSASVGAALTPTFGTPLANSSGFNVAISNFDSKFTYSVSSTLGAATINTTGVVAVLGLPPGSSSTVTVKTSRTGYTSGSGSITGASQLGAPLNPIVGPQNTVPSGLAFQVSNYDPQFTWLVSTTLGTSSISPSGLITLNGLTPGSSFSFTVTTSRNGFNNGILTKYINLPVGAALNPVFGDAVPIANGFTVQITNFDPEYQWSVMSSTGAAAIDQSGLVTVTKLNAGEGTLLTVKSSRNGYNLGMGNIRGSAKPQAIPVQPNVKKSPVATQPTRPVVTSATSKAIAPASTKPTSQKKVDRPVAGIITCTNGSTTKRIVGYNPRCPSGFAKKG